MFGFNKKTQWYKVDKLPQEKEEIIIITPENDVYTGMYENYRVTLYEFMGMPYFTWKLDVKFWTTKKEFFKQIKEK